MDYDTTIPAAELNGLDLSRPVRMRKDGVTYEGTLRAVGHGRKLVQPGSNVTLTIGLESGRAAVETVDGGTAVELSGTPDRDGA